MNRSAICSGLTGVVVRGIGATSNSGPLQVYGLGSAVRAISAGHDYSCAVAADAIWCWGSGTWYPTPVPFP